MKTAEFYKNYITIIRKLNVYTDFFLQNITKKTVMRSADESTYMPGILARGLFCAL